MASCRDYENMQPSIGTRVRAFDKDSLGFLKWGSMRCLTVFGVLPSVDGCWHASSLVKRQECRRRQLSNVGAVDG